MDAVERARVERGPGLARCARRRAGVGGTAPRPILPPTAPSRPPPPVPTGSVTGGPRSGPGSARPPGRSAAFRRREQREARPGLAEDVDAPRGARGRRLDAHAAPPLRGRRAGRGEERLCRRRSLSSARASRACTRPCAGCASVRRPPRGAPPRPRATRVGSTATRTRRSAAGAPASAARTGELARALEGLRAARPKLRAGPRARRGRARRPGPRPRAPPGRAARTHRARRRGARRGRARRARSAAARPRGRARRRPRAAAPPRARAALGARAQPQPGAGDHAERAEASR